MSPSYFEHRSDASILSGLSIKSFDIHPSRVSAGGCMDPTDGMFKNFLDAPLSSIC